MSHKATYWAIQQELPALQKLVLIILADRHNGDTGRCDPSMDRIAKDCGMSKDSARRAVRELCDKGLLTARQRRKQTVCLSNYYVLNFSKAKVERAQEAAKSARFGGSSDAKASVGVGANSTQGSSTQHWGVGADSTPNQEVEPGSEPNASQSFALESKVERGSDRKKATDPRYKPCVDAYARYAKRAGVICAWDSKAGVQLNYLLNTLPDLTVQLFEQCLLNRERSPRESDGEAPHVWLPRLLSFQQGPKNHFNGMEKSNGAAQSNQGSGPASPVWRQHESQLNIGTAGVRRYGESVVTDDGGDSGPLSESDVAQGHPRYVPGAMGGDGGGVRDGDFSSRTLEGNS